MFPVPPCIILRQSLGLSGRPWVDSSMGGLVADILYWGRDLTGQVVGLPVGICLILSSLGVVPVSETYLLLSICSGPGTGQWWWVES